MTLLKRFDEPSLKANGIRPPIEGDEGHVEILSFRNQLVNTLRGMLAASRPKVLTKTRPEAVFICGGSEV